MSGANDASGSGAGRIIFSTALLSIAWLLLLYWLFVHSQPCQGAAAYAGFVVQWVECRTSNEIGDFLAGAFAPLAFIWLAVAVIIQSTELALQREELALSRAEAVETRRAIEAHAEEARKQAEYIGAQTRLLEEAERARAAERKSREFQAMVERLGSTIRANPTACYASTDEIGEYGAAMGTADLFPQYRYRDVDDPKEVVWAIGATIAGEFKQFVENKSQLTYRSRRPEEFEKVFVALDEALQSYDDLPLESRIEADRLSLKDIKVFMRKFAVEVVGLEPWR